MEFRTNHLKIIHTPAELKAWRDSLPAGETVGFVPTMGALHTGHLALVQQSRARCARTVVSIFVNPLQFGPSEDFSRYPRTLADDCYLLAGAAVDVVFAPAVEDFYAPDASTYVVEESVSQPLCGEFRPGHFRGVATVVLKLFNLVRPDLAFFGQKDAQQCAVIERMVRDLHVPVEIVRGETVREADGLALSSRNRYLSAEERERAPLIYKSLQAAAQALASGERSAPRLEEIGRGMLAAEPEFKIQYWEARHPCTLARIEEVGAEGVLFAVAAYLGKTRLIDNLQIREGG